MATLSFYGAAETVTGSKYLLQAGQSQVLFDCGLFQGLKELRLKNWEGVPFDPAKLDAVVLTHAHLDHTGYLPRLQRDGFNNSVYCTPATRRLTELILDDAARIQEEDAERANRKGYSKHHPALPLFDHRDAERAMALLRSQQRGDWFTPAAGIECRFHDAGHLLGSAMIEVRVTENGRSLTLLYSGDVGRYDAPLYFDPAPPPACDYLICESTYGNRDHPPVDVLQQLRDVVLGAVDRGGVMLFSAFAVGRAQQLIYLLSLLIHNNRIPEMPIFVDSPMATRATDIYCRFRDDHDLSEGELQGENSALEGPFVEVARTRAESKRINKVKGPAVIISSSGMMTGGRILHHLEQRLDNPKNTIVIGGFQAAGTRGRRLLQGDKTLRMHGRDIPVKAAVVEISGLSAHAGRSELLRWLQPLAAKPPRMTFFTHGEKESATALAEQMRRDHNWSTCVPRLEQSFELEF